MAIDAYVKQGDTLPVIQSTLTDATGAPVNVTGGTVLFSMTAGIGQPAKVAGGTATFTAGGGSAGVVSYAWKAADTDTAGVYFAEWLYKAAGGGGSEHFPNDGYLTIVVLPKVN